MKRLLALLVVLLALAGASAATARPENRWPAAAEHAFLVNCYRTSGGNVAGCKCELHWLENHYTVNQISAIFLHDPVRTRKIILKAALACIH
jgi:hypothetical protein